MRTMKNLRVGPIKASVMNRKPSKLATRKCGGREEYLKPLLSVT